jgi:hypothetical protein
MHRDRSERRVVTAEEEFEAHLSPPDLFERYVLLDD